MEGVEISVVLSRASELRSKISNCIDKATHREDEENEVEGEHSSSSPSVDDTESLLSIRDALESLEEVLASLQALQQQQRYEREATLAEIDHSRKALLTKINEYKGDDLEVIREVSSFASETVEHDNDLLLPPYPSHPHPLILDKGYSSNFHSAHKLSRNGLNNFEPLQKERKVTSELERTGTPEKTAPKGLRLILSVAAKTVLTLVGVVSILSLAGFEPRVRRKSLEFGVMDVFQKSSAEEKVIIQCPPGKVLVMENGEQRCLVKERVEIPFEPVVTTPNVSYGCG